jgi:hypothetical protein
MRKDVFERRAAEMRARLLAERESIPTHKTQKKAEPGRPLPMVPAPVVPGLPSIEPHQLLDRIWKPAYTKALLDALPSAHAFVVRTVRQVGTLQVGYDGLLSLAGKDALDLNVSLGALVPALRWYGIFIERITALGGKVELAPAGTLVHLDGEKERIRLREGTNRHEKPVSPGYIYGGYTYEANGLLYLVVMEDGGGKHKTLIQSAQDVDLFVKTLQRVVARRPQQRADEEAKQRAWQAEREREQKQARLRAEEERQRREEQQHFDTFYKDITRWEKAEQIRSYLEAFTAEYELRHGKIPIGSKADGWLRWMHYYAERLDPLTNDEGPGESAEGFGQPLE